MIEIQGDGRDAGRWKRWRDARLMERFRGMEEMPVDEEMPGNGEIQGDGRDAGRWRRFSEMERSREMEEMPVDGEMSRRWKRFKGMERSRGMEEMPGDEEIQGDGGDAGR
ncbi:unnamed protein product [Lampetra fluviatilis]